MAEEYGYLHSDRELEAIARAAGALNGRAERVHLAINNNRRDYPAINGLRLKEMLLEGERKHVTVLFADIKDSMELLADRDPEQALLILDPVLAAMIEAVHRYEGTVNQVLGGGIMALFGAPVAHEDHAIRAGYAALTMVGAITRANDHLRRQYGVEVQVRVGLNSGEVVVRSIASDLHMDYSAVGQTTHLAARMEQLATPGTIRLPPPASQQRLEVTVVWYSPALRLPSKRM